MKKFIALIAVVVLVVGAWCGGWLWGAGQIRQELAALGTADGQNAPRITCGTTNVTGFPFRFDVECTGASIVDGDVTVSVAGIRASLLAYNPTHLVFSALAPVTFNDAFSGMQGRVDFTGGEGSARLLAADPLRGLIGEGWRIARISVIADNLKWVDTVLGERPMVQADHAEIQIIDIPEQHDAAAGTAALAGYATLRAASAPGYGLTEGDVSLEAELTRLPDDVRNYSGDVLGFWERQQGELKLVNFRGTSGEDYIESTGAFRLASGSHVDGTLSVKSKGLVERLGDTVPADLRALTLGQQAADGSYSQTLNIKAGIVFIGLVPVAMIPPLSAIN